MHVTGTPTKSQTFEYSLDGDTWYTFTPDTTKITLTNVGDKVYFRGNNPNGVSESEDVYYTFNTTGNIISSGSVMGLVDNGACTTTEIPNEYCFYRLFYMGTISTSPKLSATTLKNYCYKEMFYGNTNLSTLPELPATTLTTGCYEKMFGGCGSLVISNGIGIGYDKQFRIPPVGNFTNTITQTDMFNGCAKGSGRSSDNLVATSGSSVSNYTKFNPGTTNIVNGPTNLNPTFDYTGSLITNGYIYDSNKVTMAGNDSGTNVGSYSSEYSLKSGYVWSDGTTAPKTVVLNIVARWECWNTNGSSIGNIRYADVTSINESAYPESGIQDDKYYSKLSVSSAGTKPSITTPEITYTGSEITNGFTCPERAVMTGSDKGTEVGTYTATYTLKDGYTWSDGTTDAITITLTIKSAIIYVGPKPTNPDPVNYDGTEHTNGYTCPTGVSMTGNDRGTNAGTYTASYTPQTGYAWDDGTQDTVSINLVLTRASVGEKPSGQTFNYDGGTKSPYSIPAGVNSSGTTSAVSGGNYTAYYVPDDNHCWSDNSTDTVTITWTIQYVWQKWDAVVLSYAEGTSSSSVFWEGTLTETKYITGTNRSYTFDASTGFFTLQEHTSGGHQHFTLDDYERQLAYVNYPFIGPNGHGTITSNRVGIVTSGYLKYSKSKIYTDGSMTTKYTVPNYSKGGTYYGNVSSTSNIYPENGRHSDGYWYVKTW